MKDFHLSKKFWAIISALVVIGALFAYYLLVHVKGREANIVAEKYRILKRIGKNAIAIKTDYDKRIDNYSRTYAKAKPLYDKVYARVNELEIDLYILDDDLSYLKLEAQDADYANDREQKKTKEREIKQKEKERIKKEKERRVELKKIAGIDSDLKTNLKSLDLEIVRQKYESVKYDNLDTLYFKIKPISSPLDDYTYNYDYYGRPVDQSDSCLAVSLKSFLNKSNFSHDQFNDFLLIRVLHKKATTESASAPDNSYSSDEQQDDNKTYNFKIDCCGKKKDKSDKDSVISSIAFQTFESKIDLNLKHFDSLFVEDHGLRSVPAIDISLAGTSYKMFQHRMQFAADEEWILCGLVKSSNFKKSAREIDTWKLTFTLLIVIFLFLAMPILKLMIMSAIERLRIINVWSAGFSLTVGTSLLVLILLSANEIVGYKTELDNRLGLLSKDIKGRFIEELNTIYNQLALTKTVYKANPARLFELRSEIFKTDSLKNVEFLHHRFFNEILWLDKDANQRLRITTYKQDSMTVPLNLNKRKYFTRPIHDSLWILPNPKRSVPDAKKKFAIESIRSWISGKHEAGISIKLDSTNGPAAVLAMATKLYSVMDPVLPPGYGFCIIDDSGEVWFHSETKRNTQENFLEETHQNEEIKASIRGRLAKHSIEVLYNDNPHRLFIQPIDGIPLYLITFYDLEYYKAPMLLTLYFTLMLIVLLFSLQGLQLFLLFISVYKSTKLKIKRFFLKWLRPRKNHVKLIIEAGRTMLPAEKYIRSILVQALLILLLLFLVFIRPHSHTIIFCFLILPIYLFPFQYFLHEREEIIRDRKKLGRHPFIWLSGGLVMLINLSFYKYIDCKVATIVQLVLIGILFTGYHLKQPIRKLSEGDWIAKRHFGKLYFIMVLMWLSITAVLPVLYFYQAVSFQENLNWKKYLEWETAKQDFTRDDHFKREWKLSQVDHDAMREKGNYIVSTCEFNIQPDISKYEQQQPSSFHDLQFDAHPPFTGLIEKARGMLAIATADKKWHWENHKEKPDVLISFTNDDGQTRFYDGSFAVHSFWKSDYFPLFLVLFVAFAFLILYATNFIVRSIFGLGLVTDSRFIEYAHEEVTADQMMGLLSASGKAAQSERVFIVGLPYSGKSELISEVKQKFSTQGISVEVFDFRCDLEKRLILTGQKVFVVTHFEYGINDHLINQKKIEGLQKLLNSGAHIILSSTVQPSAVLEFYESALQRINPQKSEELRKEWTEYKHAIRMWKNLVSGFIVLYQPLSKNLPNTFKSAFAMSELHHGHYLTKTNLLLEKEPCRTYEEKENFVLRVEELADTYYQSLWNSFSNSEKHLLYDLAKDRFVNLRNLTTIRILMQKGVIIAEDTLSIMNKSFSNFILSAVNEDEEVRMEKELHQKGAWSMVRSVLIVALIGLATFITLAQQNLLQDFNLLLGAVGSVAALLTRFGGLFATSKVKEL